MIEDDPLEGDLVIANSADERDVDDNASAISDVDSDPGSLVVDDTMESNQDDSADRFVNFSKYIYIYMGLLL